MTDATAPPAEEVSSNLQNEGVANPGPNLLPRPFGGSILTARLRVQLEDFRVDERLGFSLDGAGEHLFLRVCKRGANTVFVASALARWAGIPERGVGFAGMKDRHAVTLQTFSLHLPGREAPIEAPLTDEFEIVDRVRHGRKLPRGALAGNAFELTLRDVEADRDALAERLAQIAEFGYPNYFGVQRFGRDGGNLAEAQKLFAGQRMKREKRSILLSAARSAVFNAILARRVEAGSWASGLPGEVWMLDGSHSVFGPVADDPAIAERALRGDIHPTGALWGAGDLRSAGEANQLESEIGQSFEAICAGLAKAGLKQERRALRVRPAGLEHHWLDNDVLRLSFFLPAGTYATSLLHALGDVTDMRR